jgi:hypothetical protein
VQEDEAHLMVATDPYAGEKRFYVVEERDGF